jgi:hypothetical protein
MFDSSGQGFDFDLNSGLSQPGIESTFVASSSLGGGYFIEEWDVTGTDKYNKYFATAFYDSFTDTAFIERIEYYNDNDIAILVSDFSVSLQNLATTGFSALIAGNDVIIGNSFSDRIEGYTGNDSLDGGAGIDTAVYSGDQNSYSLVLTRTGASIEDRRADGNGTDTLSSIEFLDFGADLTGEPFDLQQFGGASGLTAQDFESFIEFYIAYFNRTPDAIGLNFWGTAFANGTTLEEMATYFIDQDETRATYPDGTSNTDFVTAVYDNVLGRIPDQDGFDFWVDMLNRSEETGVTRDQFILEVLRGVQDGSPDRAYLDTKVDIGAYFAVHRGMSDTDNASAAMALFDGSQGSVNDAVAAIDGYYQDALDPTNGEFLMQVVGVLDNPFA